MSNNLLISYDLFSPERDDGKVAEVIKSLGDWTRIHQSFWYVKSEHSAHDAAKIIWETMSKNDPLCVFDATNNHAAYYKLEFEVSDFMNKHWQRG